MPPVSDSGESRIIHVVLIYDTLARGTLHLVRFGLSSNSALHFNAGWTRRPVRA